MSYHSPVSIERILNMAVAATETMNTLDTDPDIIKTRLRLIREIADGLGINIKIPTNRAVMIKRMMSSIKDN